MDNTVLLLPLILSSLIATTSSLTCVECRVQGDKFCQGTKVVCPPGADVCVVTLESSTKDEKEMMTLSRHCGERSMCSYSESLTTAFGGKKLSSTCCYTNDCTPPLPTFPTGKTEKNGVSCKSCDTEKGMPCESSSPMACTGDEKECVLMTNVTTQGETSSINFVGGCGTLGWCRVKEQMISNGEKATKISYTCSGGNDAHPPGLPLMLLAALFIMKIIS